MSFRVTITISAITLMEPPYHASVAVMVTAWGPVMVTVAVMDWLMLTVSAFLWWASVFRLPEHVCSIGGRPAGRRGGSGAAGRAQRSEPSRSAAEEGSPGRLGRVHRARSPAGRRYNRPQVGQPKGVGPGRF